MERRLAQFRAVFFLFAWRYSMKCIRFKRDNTIHRVPDTLAHHVVTVTKEAVYIPKKEWKAAFRPQQPVVAVSPVNIEGK
jgi:hypothetical protein